MATETRTTTEREDAPTGAGAAVSEARHLSQLEGQVSILLLNVEDLRRQVRENYRAHDAKIDRMDAKIDGVNARIDRHFYWTLGLCVAIIITVVGSAIGLAIRLGG